MKTVAQKLTHSLNQILEHDPWYSPPVYDILDRIHFEAAYEKPGGSVHSIAGILLHMLGWAQEVTSRMSGNPAAEPAVGDWPDPGAPDEERWKRLISDFKLANVNLTKIITDLNAHQWNTPINDERNRELGTGVTYQALIEGLIQHHIYHSGQIALLNRIVSG